MHWLIWIAALVALAGWTLLAWATAWVLGLDPSLIGNLADRLGDMPGSAWLDLAMPGWEPVAVAMLQLTRDLFAALGTVGTWLVWGAWAVGAVLVVGLAALASAAVGVARRVTAPAAAPAR